MASARKNSSLFFCVNNFNLHLHQTTESDACFFLPPYSDTPLVYHSSSCSCHNTVEPGDFNEDSVEVDARHPKRDPHDDHPAAINKIGVKEGMRNPFRISCICDF